MSRALVITRRGRRRSYHKPVETEEGVKSKCDMIDEDRDKKLLPLEHAQEWYKACGVCFDE